MSLHDILMQRAMLQHPEFREDYGKGEPSKALDNFTNIALYSAKLAQDRIAEEQKAENDKRNYESSLAQGMKIASSLNDDASRVQATVGVNQDGKISASFTPIKQESDADRLKAQREERIAKQQEYSNASRLGSEFINRPEVKNYVETSTQLNLMDKAYSAWKAGGQNSANALDQALVNTFGRMIDPGVSIREAEYRRTPENMSLINRTEAAFQRLSKGGVLNNAEREDLIKVAKILGEARGEKYNETYNEYDSIADQFSLEKKLVTRGMKPFSSGVAKDVNVSTDKIYAVNKQTGERIVSTDGGNTWNQTK